MIKKMTAKFFIGLFIGIFFGETIIAAPLASLYYYRDSSSGSVYKIKKNLISMGYRSKLYKDYGAFYVRKNMDKDVVFYYSGKGSAGLLKCNGKTQISAKIVPDNSNNYSLENAFYKTPNKLKKVRLAYFSASNTANTSPVYGNLLTYTVIQLKAGVAVGFSKKVSKNVLHYYDSRFFYQLFKGLTVENAIDEALKDTKKNFSKSVYDQSNIASVCYVGNSYLKIKIKSDECPI